LIIVLIVIGVISLVMSVILSQADTSVRSTVALRDQASTNFGADGATNAVLNALKTSGINCDNPSSPPPPVILGTASSPFYVPDNSTDGRLNAYAQCTADALQGVTTSVSVSASTSFSTPPPVTSTAPYLGQGDSTLPTYAVLTTGSSVGSGGTDFGLDFSGSSNNTSTFIENGSVGSKANVNATNQCLIVRLSTNGGDTNSNCNQINNFGSGVDSTTNTSLVVKAQNQCVGGASVYKPTSCQSNATDVTIPAAPSLPGSIVAADPPATCKTSGNTTYAALFPGYYDSVGLAILNTPCGNIGNNTLWEWLTPGAYYFNYGSSQWTWPSVLIGGTPTSDAAGTVVSGLNPSASGTLTRLAQTAPAPNACADPAGTATESGVTMVFGGASTAAANTTQGNFAQICASSPTAGGQPPLAIYGLTQSQSVTGPGASTTTMPAETLCTSTGCGGQGSSGTSLINTAYANSSGHASVYIKGYVYAPQAQMLLRLYNAAGQIFNWGVIVRNLALVLNGSSPNQPVFKLPRPNTGIGTVVTTSTPPASTIVNTATATVTTYTIRYINVWTCTLDKLDASGQCPHAGLPNVQVKVRTSGSTLQILSWSHIG
jgi:hypothetical protein